ncbi:MAG: hypothetical protein V4618_12625 [Pseudomonadota bacterium]
MLGCAVQAVWADKPRQAEISRETYRQRCLLCHKVPPDGIAPEIVAGLAVRPGPRARELMPNTTCWRRCEKCWPAAPAAR